nr:MAG TPA: hypothetical protein [Caudoviricetes sp.]
MHTYTHSTTPQGKRTRASTTAQGIGAHSTIAQHSTRQAQHKQALKQREQGTQRPTEATQAKSERSKASHWPRCSASPPTRLAVGTYQATHGLRGEEGAVFLAIKSKKIFAFRYAKQNRKEETDYGAGKKTACRP